MTVGRARVVFALLAVAALLAANGTSLVPPSATAQAGLFSDRGGRSEELPPPHPAVVRERAVDVNFPLLESVSGPTRQKNGPGGTLNLNLFTAGPPLYPDVSLTATRDRVERTSSGRGTIWSGHVPGDALSQVTLVAEDGVMAGDIRAHGRVFNIRGTSNGGHVIYEINPAAFPPDEHPAAGGVGGARAAVAAAITGQAAPRADAPAPAAASGAAPGVAADTSSSVDFMVVYTAAAATDAGGGASMRAQIDLAVASVNQAYINSGVGFRARLVYKGQVNYNETGDIFGTDVANLRAGNITDSNGQTVASLRNQYGADIVSMITAPSGNYCGIAYVMFQTSASFASSAFNVVAGYLCATSNYSLAHESGHNMGLCHDWITNDCPNKSVNPPDPDLTLPWAHGYVDPQNRFRDIMSYPQSCGSCPRVQYYSTLAASYQGNPIGTAHGQAQQADNANALNSNAGTVANFRTCVVAPCNATALSNDAFTGATAVTSLPASFTISNTSATTEAGEPLTPSCLNGTGSVGKTIWYYYTPSVTTSVIVSTSGSSFDTVLAVYTGNAVGSLVPVACNDDAAPGQVIWSQVGFTAVAGTTYRIQLGGFNGDSSTATVAFSGVAATASPTASCSPRPTVSISSTPIGNNQLQVTITPSGNARLLSLQIGAASNALVDVNGQTGLTGGNTVNLPPETLSVTLIVRRKAAGPTTVPLTVVDGCGSWPTLVGGGGSAF